MAGFGTRVKYAWNVLVRGDPGVNMNDLVSSDGPSGNNNSRRDSKEVVLAPIINRVSIDASAIPIRHVNVDEFGKYKSNRPGELNKRLSWSANIDQTGAAFIQNAVTVLMEEGCCVIVPIEVDSDPTFTTAYSPLSLRVGVVKRWFTKHVEVEVYDEISGKRLSKTLPKSYVAIAYNPLYNVMNSQNSTLRRLLDKIALLDTSDNRVASPNLDLILKLPFALSTTKRQQEAIARLDALNQQLYNSRYGVAYIDATENVTQLNRPVVNTLSEQVEKLTTQLYNQLGLTESVFNGTANQEEMLAYQNRTVFPILKALAESMAVTFLTDTAVAQGQAIMVFPDLFKMVPLPALASAADLLTRNEILTSNEVRSYMGLERKEDPAADELRNKNLNQKEVTTNDSTTTV